MRFSKTRMRCYHSAGIVVVALSACASSPPSDASRVGEAAQALDVVDCQNKAAECLGTLPSQEKITSCREEIKGCIDQLQTELQQRAGELAECASAAKSCAQGAEAFSDLMTCRQGFEDCVGIEFDEANVPVPQFPMLPPEVGAAIDGANKCREDAVSCVKAGSGSASEVSTCAKTYRGCVIALLPEPSGEGTQPPTVPPEVGAAIDGANKCREDAVSCVEAGSGSASEIATCADAFRGCISSLLPTPSGSEGPSELPGLPGSKPPTGGSDCLDGLRQCLSSDKSPAECATEARSCIGVPTTAPAIPTEWFAKPKQA